MLKPRVRSIVESSLSLRRAAMRSVVAIVVALGAVPPPASAVVPPGLTNFAGHPNETQHAFKCQKLTNKNTAKYLSTLSKTYLKCLGAVATCVQVKGSDPDCLAKAVAGCNSKIATLGDDLEKDAGTVLEDAITEVCGFAQASEAFSDEGGPHFDLLGSRCSATYIQAYEGCLFRQTNCAAERMLLVEMPRARDLLDDAGITTGHAVDAQHSCLLDESGSGSLDGDGSAGKALLACQLKVAKAGASFAGKARGAFAKCADAVMNCAQLKRTDKCVDSAAKTCTKAVASVDDSQTKLHDAIVKDCENTPLPDLENANGGDVSALTSLCNSVNVASVASLDDYATCVAKYERCQVEDSIDFTVPRIEEFFTDTQQPGPFNSAFCPAP